MENFRMFILGVIVCSLAFMIIGSVTKSNSVEVKTNVVRTNHQDNNLMAHKEMDIEDEATQADYENWQGSEEAINLEKPSSYDHGEYQNKVNEAYYGVLEGTIEKEYYEELEYNSRKNVYFGNDNN